MAYLATDEEDEKQQDQEQKGSEKVLGAPSADVDAGTGTMGSAGGGGASSPATSRKSGSGWTNLQDFIKANEGNDAKLGSTIQGGYDEKAKAATDASTTYGTTASNAVKQGTKVDNGVSKKVGAGGANLTDTDKQQFYSNVRGWEGPESAEQIEGYTGAQKGVDAAKNYATTAQDFSGRQAILADKYARPDYTQGQQRFDSFLAGAGAQGKKALDTVDQGAKSLGTGWNDLISHVAGDVDQGKKTSEATRAASTNALTSATGKLNGMLDTVTAKAKVKNAAIAQEQSATEAKLMSHDPIQQQQALKRLGYTGKDLQGAIDHLRRGGDPRVLFQNNGLRTGSDFLSSEWDPIYQNLSELSKNTGIGSVSDFDMKRSGTMGKAAANTNTYATTQAADARALEAKIAARLAQQQQARDTEYGNVHGGITGPAGLQRDDYLKRIGVDPAAWDKAISLGVDPTTFLQKGRALDRGDVANEFERKHWGELAKYLGYDGSYDDAGDEGSAYSFDRPGFDGALQNAQATPVTSAKAPAAAPSQRSPIQTATAGTVGLQPDGDVDQILSDLAYDPNMVEDEEKLRPARFGTMGIR